MGAWTKPEAVIGDGAVDTGPVDGRFWRRVKAAGGGVSRRSSSPSSGLVIPGRVLLCMSRSCWLYPAGPAFLPWLAAKDARRCLRSGERYRVFSRHSIVVWPRLARRMCQPVKPPTTSPIMPETTQRIT